MATKKPATPNLPAKIVRPQTTAVAVNDYRERLARFAQRAVATEASVQTGSFLSVQAGQLTYQGNPVPGNELDVVVVDAVMENAYYSGPYDPNNKQPPICYAFGRDDKEMSPHPEATDKQAERCADCQWNKFGTAVRNDGSPADGKACKNIRRLALIPADQAGSPEQVQKAEDAFLKLPVTSVKGWAGYVRTLMAVGELPPQGVVTKIKVTPDRETQFKVGFEQVDVIADPAVGMAILAKAEEIEPRLTAAYPKPEDNPAPAPAARGRAAAPAAKAAPRGRAGAPTGRGRF